MAENENQSRHYPVKENMRWQRIKWCIQHAGFTLPLIVAAGAAGLFSKGWLSNQSIASPDKRLRGDYYQLRRRGPQLDNIQLQPQPLALFTYP